MKKLRNFLVVILAITITSACKNDQDSGYQSETLTIKKLGEYTYMHTSYLPIEKWGKVPCNGMVVIENEEAVVVDTPVDNEVTTELLKWIEMRAKIKGVIPTHFHEDCIGGIEVFKERKIPVYVYKRTEELLSNKNMITHEFGDFFELPLGKQKIVCQFFGEGHTKDNIVVYSPKDSVLFGGCLVKSLKASKGNLADVNIYQWSETVKDVKEYYKQAKLVIPGHGREGDLNLLTYTTNLFKNEEK